MSAGARCMTGANLAFRSGRRSFMRPTTEVFPLFGVIAVVGLVIAAVPPGLRLAVLAFGVVGLAWFTRRMWRRRSRRR